MVKRKFPSIGVLPKNKTNLIIRWMFSPAWKKLAIILLPETASFSETMPHEKTIGCAYLN